MLPSRSSSGAGAVGTEEPEQHPTIAGRALRALRTTRAPAEPDVPAPDVDDPVPVADAAPCVESEPVAESEPVVESERIGESVGLVKTPRPNAAARPRRHGLLIASLVALVAAVAFG